MRKSLLIGIAAIVVGTSAAAFASTIDTYNFSQGGYTMPGATGALTGSFTGTVESSGLIESRDLSSFAVLFTDTNGSTTSTAVGSLFDIVFFSFNTMGGASTLDLQTSLFPSKVPLCIGAEAAFGVCGAGPVGVATNGAFTGFFTQDQPTLTLVSSVTTGPSGGGTSPVPEPGSAVLLVTGLAALGLGRQWRLRRLQQARS